MWPGMGVWPSAINEHMLLVFVDTRFVHYLSIVHCLYMHISTVFDHVLRVVGITIGPIHHITLISWGDHQKTGIYKSITVQ